MLYIFLVSTTFNSLYIFLTEVYKTYFHIFHYIIIFILLHKNCNYVIRFFTNTCWTCLFHSIILRSQQYIYTTWRSLTVIFFTYIPFFMCTSVCRNKILHLLPFTFRLFFFFYNDDIFHQLTHPLYFFFP